MTYLKLAAATAMTVLLVGCTAAQAGPASLAPLSGASTTAVPTQAASTPSITQTPYPTMTLDTPAPTDSVEPSAEPVSGQADVKVVRQVLKKWQDQYSVFVSAQVIIEVVNEGSGWADMSGGESDYTLYAKDGSVAETGRFLYQYPVFLAPGATGYLLDDPAFDDTKLANLAKVDSDIYFGQVDSPDPLMTTSKLTIKSGSFDTGFDVTGIAKNTSVSTDISGAVVGCVFSDTSGVPVGFSYTNLIENVKAGQSKGFATVGGSAPLARTAIKKVACYASSTDF